MRRQMTSVYTRCQSPSQIWPIPTTRTHFDVLRRRSPQSPVASFPLGIIQSCAVQSDTAVYQEPEMTWEVVAVAFKLGSSFLKDRKIKEKKHWHWLWHARGSNPASRAARYMFLQARHTETERCLQTTACSSEWAREEW